MISNVVVVRMHNTWLRKLFYGNVSTEKLHMYPRRYGKITQVTCQTKGDLKKLLAENKNPPFTHLSFEMWHNGNFSYTRDAQVALNFLKE